MSDRHAELELYVVWEEGGHKLAGIPGVRMFVWNLYMLAN